MGNKKKKRKGEHYNRSKPTLPLNLIFRFDLAVGFVVFWSPCRAFVLCGDACFCGLVYFCCFVYVKFSDLQPHHHTAYGNQISQNYAHKPGGFRRPIIFLFLHAGGAFGGRVCKGETCQSCLRFATIFPDICTSATSNSEMLINKHIAYLMTSHQNRIINLSMQIFFIQYRI